jgi:hypothetical protein
MGEFVETPVVVRFGAADFHIRADVSISQRPFRYSLPSLHDPVDASPAMSAGMASSGGLIQEYS